MKTILKLSLKTFALLATSFFFGAFAAGVLGFPESAVTGGAILVAASFIPYGNLKASFYTIIAADIVTEWGAYYRAEGQGMKDLMLKLVQRSVTAAYFPTRITEKTILEKASAEFTRVLQRFQKTWTPVGGVTFEPLKIPLYKLKIDLQETPDDVEETWAGFLGDHSLSRKEWPFTRWYLTNALIQADKDLENYEIYNGVPGTITPGTATAAGASLKGIKKQINEFVAAGKTAPVVLGAVPTTDALAFVTYVENLFKGSSRLLRNELDYGFMSEDLHDLFRDGMRLKYNVQYPSVDETKITKLRNDNIKIVGLPSMAGSTKIWSTPEWNRQAGFKKPMNERIFEVENVDRTVKAYTDYYRGFGFWIPQYVVTNDVELI